jgi:hypothetical protein
MPSNKNVPLQQARKEINELSELVSFLCYEIEEMKARLSSLESRQVLPVYILSTPAPYDPFTYNHGPTCDCARLGTVLTNGTGNAPVVERHDSL